MKNYKPQGIVVHYEMATEEWKPAPGYPSYWVSNRGRFARQLKTGRLRYLVSTVHITGYVYVFPYVDGKKQSVSHHRIVAIAFIGKPPEGRPSVNHRNGIRCDNRPENLEWVSTQENARHAQDNGLFVQHRGSKHGMAKLHESQVEEIKSLLREGLSNRIVAQQIGCGEGTVSHIRTGRQWSHVR